MSIDRTAQDRTAQDRTAQGQSGKATSGRATSGKTNRARPTGQGHVGQGALTLPTRTTTGRSPPVRGDPGLAILLWGSRFLRDPRGGSTSLRLAGRGGAKLAGLAGRSRHLPCVAIDNHRCAMPLMGRHARVRLAYPLAAARARLLASGVHAGDIAHVEIAAAAASTSAGTAAGSARVGAARRRTAFARASTYRVVAAAKLLLGTAQELVKAAAA